MEIKATACPFCSETIAPGAGPRARHIGRHLEDVALTAIPRSYSEWQYYEDSSSAVTEASTTPTHGIYKCTSSDCYQSFASYSQLQEHRWNEHRAGAPGNVSTWMQEPSPVSTPMYRCKYFGCTAQPFVTQDLLNWHTEVHSQDGPHYCPVAGCPRAEGGKGFKRKDELTRHGTVHLPKDYICPFCPDRQRKFARPYSLRRHVKDHHPDKDRDNPQLLSVLERRY